MQKKIVPGRPADQNSQTGPSPQERAKGGKVTKTVKKPPKKR